MKHWMVIPNKLPRRMRRTLVPRMHIMNGGRSVRGWFTHGDKFYVNGKHFVFHGPFNGWVKWAERKQARVNYTPPTDFSQFNLPY